MRKLVCTAGAALALAMAAGMSVPENAAAATASVCQFYRGEPLCKTVQESYCLGGSAGLEGRACRTTTEYWYWS